MKKHYETLGLNAGASKEEIVKKYLLLSKKYDPKENDNLEFFKEEYDKVQEAYKALTKSSILKNSDKKAKIKPVYNSTLGNKTESKNVENMPTIPEKKTVSSENYVFRNVLLLFISLGILGIFMQNMGFFVPSDDFTQKVRDEVFIEYILENGKRIKVRPEHEQHFIEYNPTAIRKGIATW